MSGKRITDVFCYEEWEFDTAEELKAAATEEARVCGDRIDERASCVEIYNFHQNRTRWLGRVKKMKTIERVRKPKNLTEALVNLEELYQAVDELVEAHNEKEKE